MPTNSTPRAQKGGRRKLSPNDVDQQLRREQRERRRPLPERGHGLKHTLAAKRLADYLRRGQRKQLHARRLAEPLGQTVRRRLRAVRGYLKARREQKEAAAAQQAATQWRISVSTVRRWARLYRSGGVAALLPQPRGPQPAGAHTNPQVEALVVVLRRLLGWNEKRLAQELRQRGLAQISHSSVGRIFARYHLPTRTYHSVAPRLGVPFARYEKDAPNRQWHIDFLETKLADGQRVVLVAMIDDYSRFCVYCDVAELTTTAACQALLRAIYQHGRPEEIVSDNGSVFIGPGGPTFYGTLLRYLDIRERHTAPYWPQANGKAEAFGKILKHECLTHCASLEELRQAVPAFVAYYNTLRLHGALGYRPPATRYLAQPAPHDHGLVGIPGLPTALSQTFPPNLPWPAQPVRPASPHFPLACISC